LNKLKKTAYFIIILSCIMIFSSCQNNTIKNVSTEIELDEENGGGTGILAENNAVDFYFYYPENFFIQRNDAMIVVYINDDEVLQIDKQEPGSEEYFSVMTKPNLSATVFGLPPGRYETIEKYWANYALPSYEEIFQDIKIESETDLIIGSDKDISARKYTYTCSLSGMKFKISEIIFFKKQQVYDLIYTATEKKYETYKNVLSTAADTFKFK